jgi:hypothetical protein
MGDGVGLTGTEAGERTGGLGGSAGSLPLSKSGSVGAWLEQTASPMERRNFFELMYAMRFIVKQFIQCSPCVPASSSPPHFLLLHVPFLPHILNILDTFPRSPVAPFPHTSMDIGRCWPHLNENLGSNKIETASKG